MRKLITTEDRRIIAKVSRRRKAGMRWAEVAADIDWATEAKHRGLDETWRGLYNWLHPKVKRTKDGDLVPVA